MTPTSSEENLSSYLFIIYRKKWILILTTLIVLFSTIMFLPKEIPTYNGSITLMVRTPQLSNPSLKDVDISLDPTVITYIRKVIQSRTLAEMVIKALKIKTIKMERDKGEFFNELVFPKSIEMIQKSILVKEISDTNLIEINIYSKSKISAKILAQTVADCFIMQMFKTMKKNKDVQPYVMTEIVEPLKEELRTELIQLGIERASELRKYTEKHPKVVKLTNRINEVMDTLNQLGTQEIQITDVEIAKDVQVTQMSKKSNRKPKVIMGGFIGLVVGICLIFLIEHMDTSFKVIQDVNKLFPYPVIGTIPFFPKSKQSTLRKNLSILELQSSIEMLKAPQSPISEAFRSLRTNIEHSNPEHKAKSYLFTSVHPNEGKTTVITNLGIAMAEIYNSVLLVDSDMRKPTLHSRFGLNKEEGLSDILEEGLEWEGVVKATGISHLNIITSGFIPNNPSQLLCSPQAEALFEELKHNFDVVLVDCSSILAVTDSSVVASKMDGVIVVLRAEKTTQDPAIRAMTLLENVKANIIGFVLTAIPATSRGSYYYGYYAHPRK